MHNREWWKFVEHYALSYYRQFIMSAGSGVRESMYIHVSSVLMRIPYPHILSKKGKNKISERKRENITRWKCMKKSRLVPMPVSKIFFMLWFSFMCMKNQVDAMWWVKIEINSTFMSIMWTCAAWPLATVASMSQQVNGKRSFCFVIKYSFLLYLIVIARSLTHSSSRQWWNFISIK